MTEGVVDFLEMVDVEHDHRKRLPPAPEPQEFAGGDVLKPGEIHEAGQRVRKRRLLELDPADAVGQEHRRQVLLGEEDIEQALEVDP